MRRSARSAPVLAFALATVVATACGPPPVAHHDVSRDAMGTYVRIQVVGLDDAVANDAIEAAYAEIERLEAILSEWRADSEISAINDAAGVAPVAVGPETVAVLRVALDLAERTGGAFDPTFAACGRLWSFRNRVVPSRADLDACRALVDRSAVEIDADDDGGTVFLRRPGMRIGIAGVGKGWILDRAADVLRARGLRDFSVDGGGDLVLAGRGPRGRWVLGIADPRRPGTLHGTIEAPDGAVVTSGDYMQAFEKDGVRYHHILDPRTGMPAGRSAAVTVVAPDAATADALATGLFVLGPEAALAWVEATPGVEALVFDGAGAARASSGFPEVRTAP